ncbi:MAG: hypothetical protein KF824_03875 [Fimbriimonadaceae bacterium]|nr:MAG: hypothetical protein KF824_03875 [Fimbriimonadaceae bacterium]
MPYLETMLNGDLEQNWRLVYVLHSQGRALYHPNGMRILTDEQFEEYNQTANPTKMWVNGRDVRFVNPDIKN